MIFILSKICSFWEKNEYLNELGKVVPFMYQSQIMKKVVIIKFDLLNFYRPGTILDNQLLGRSILIFTV